jgi:eukaryotic-like serine/threonine-protein kinase
MATLPGKQIGPKGRYEIKETIGRGGMGVVYRAFDSKVGRDVAVKTLRDAPSREALQLFQKECKVLASLSHPNIIEIFDIGEFEENGDRKPFFVMPYLTGAPLDKLLRAESHRLTTERAVEILQQACRGLNAGHESGLVHRDVKPSNIFVMRDDSVKIIDFGVAHMVDSGISRTQKGTLRYMAPEQIENKPLSPSSDIFSLGVVSYETLTGRWPFESLAETEDEIASAILYRTPPPASELNPAVSQTLSRVIHKALAKQPWHRYSTAQEFSDTLRKALHDEPIEIFDASRLQPRIQRARKAFEEGDAQFAAEILGGLEAEGHLDPEMTMLRQEIDQAIRQKTIQQLLEGARIRFEQDEFPLALQKIQDILRLDPQNASALALKNTIETKRVERKVDDWFRVAQQHLSNNAYDQARLALENVLQLRPGDPRAEQLLAEVNRREQEYQALRKAKEEAYKLARSAWENGEISTALSKMEWVLNVDQGSPDPKASESTTRYQVFYNEIRSAHEAMNSAYNEARKQLDARNYVKALECCEIWLRKFPAQALFQALKVDIEEQQRRERSVYIAEVDHRVDAEPDLEKRKNILKDALEKFPDEVHFKEALQHARDKFRLVSAIVEKARFYEQRAQYSEAEGQWEMLRNIHPQHPGLEYEIERVGKRREEQARQEAKERWILRIQHEMRARDYDRVLDLVQEAQAEFPGDNEFAEIGTQAQQRAELAGRVGELLEQGKALCTQCRYEEAISTLGQAYNLDQGNPDVKNALAQTLAEQARSVVESDWKLAEKWVEQALRVDPGQGLAKSLRVQIQERKRQETVATRLARSRQLREAGDLKGAKKELQQGLTEYPEEPSLVEGLRSLNERTPRPASLPGPITSPRPVAGHERGAGSASIGAHSTGTIKKSRIPSPPTPGPAQSRRTPGRVTNNSQSAALDVPWGWVKIVWLVNALAAAMVAALLIALFVIWPPRKPPVPPITISIVTVPPGAEISVNGEERGIPPQGKLSLAPGDYVLKASKGGYQPESIPLHLLSGFTPAPIKISLQPLPSGLSIYTNLAAGKVWIDQRPASDVKDGRVIVDDIAPGKHSVKVSDRSMQASFEFDAEPGTLPTLTASPEPHDLRAMYVSTFGGVAHVQLSFPSPLRIDQQQSSDDNATELDQGNLSPGAHQLVIGKGEDEITKEIEIGTSPRLTVFLDSDRKVGTLVLSTNEDNYQIFLNDKERRSQIKQGHTRIENLDVGTYVVRVSKPGYASDPPQLSVQIRKGQDTKPLVFTFKALPKFAQLRIENGLPGTSVWLDDKAVGSVSDGGRFEISEIRPGSHEVRLRKDGYKPRTDTRSFVAGKPEVLDGSLEKLLIIGTLNITAPEAESITITNGEGKSWPVVKVPNDLPAGKYVLTALWRGHPTPVQKQVQVNAGENQSVTLEMPKGSMQSWENPSGWQGQGEWFYHEGENGPILYGLKPPGRFRFTAKLERGNRIRWLADFKDSNNFIFFDVDKRGFSRARFANGATTQSFGISFGLNKDRACTLDIEITHSYIVTRMYDAQNRVWKVIDRMESQGGEDLTAGKFGFQIPPNDVVAISHFTFDPE